MAAYLAVSTGGAWAAATIGSSDIKPNAIKSRHIDNGKVRAKDLGDRAVKNTKLGSNAVTSSKVRNASLTAADIDESTVDAGTRLGDNTNVKTQACAAGDVLLSGGPANISATTDLLESFPAPGSTNTWQARINDNAVADNFSVVILCLDQ